EETKEVATDATTYTIEAGDTLFSIANQFNVTVSDLQEWNNLSTDLIFVGKTISVADDQVQADEAPHEQDTTDEKEVQEAPAGGEVEEVEEVEEVQEVEAAPAVEEVEETEEVDQPNAAPAAEPQVSGGNAASIAQSLAAGKSYVYGGNSATAVDCSA